jgi:sialidase-1
MNTVRFSRMSARVILFLTLTRFCLPVSAQSFPADLRVRSIGILRQGLASNEFWPSMHAAEGLTAAGLGEEVLWQLRDRLANETDDQRRCGLAREQVRAGRTELASVMAAVLNDPDSNGHIHACESLFKVNQIGDRDAVRNALGRGDPILELMAAAALVRAGDRNTLNRIRAHLSDAETRPRRTAAWILGQIGDESDWPAIRTIAESETEPLAIAFAWNALAKLGAPEAAKVVAANLKNPEPAVRTYSAQTLGVCGSPDHIPLLAAMLDDPTLDTRLRAAEAIVRITNRMLQSDADNDSIPDAVESDLGTPSDSPEIWHAVYDAEPTVPDAGVDPESVPPDLLSMEFCHAGKKRYVWKLRFRTPLSELRTVFHLYTRLDSNPETGRKDGFAKGVDIMYSIVDARPDPRIFTPDVRANPQLPVRIVIGGDTVWICDDLDLAVTDGKTDIQVYALSERWPSPRAEKKLGRSVPQQDIQVPLRENRNVPEVAFPKLSDFEALPPSYQVRHELRNSLTTVHLKPDPEALTGFIQHWNGDLESEPYGASSATFTIPVVGEFRIAFLGTAAGAGVTGLDVMLDGERIGTVATPSVDKPGTLFYSGLLTLSPGMKLTVVASPRSSRGRFGQFMLIQQTPELPPMQITHLETVRMPPLPGGLQDRMRVAWLTSYPVACRVRVQTADGEDHDFEEGAGPECNHGVFLPDALADTARVVTVITEPSEEHPLVSATVEIPARHVESQFDPRLSEIALTLGPDAAEAAGPLPFSSGIPFPPRTLAEPVSCRIIGADGQALPVQTRVLSRWPEGGVKWLLVDFVARANDLAQGTVALQINTRLPAVESPMTVEKTPESVVIRTGTLTWTIDRRRSDPFAGLAGPDGQPVTVQTATGLRLVDAAGTVFASASAVPDAVIVEDAGPVRATVRVSGTLTESSGNSNMRYICRLSAYAGLPWVRAEITLDNTVTDPTMSLFREVALPVRLASRATGADVFGATRDFNGTPTTLLQDYDNRCLLNGTPGEEARAPGYCAVSGEDARVVVSIRNFWQLYPKAFTASPDGIVVGLLPPLPESQYTGEEDQKLVDRLYFWCDQGRYKLKTGARVTTEVYLNIGADADPARFNADVQTRRFAVASPETYCASGALGPLVPRDPKAFPRYEQNQDRAFREFLARREKIREYGFMNYGDWYGERTWNWGNVEYDTQHALALNFIRTGNVQMLVRAEEAAIHNADIDTIHADANPENVGRVHVHCLGHTGGYFPADFKDMGSGFANGSSSTGHTWSRGHFLLWALTGNDRLRDTGEKVAEWQAATAARNPHIGYHRDGGWSLTGATGAYQVSSDPFFLNGARLLVQRILEKQRPNGQWGHSIWEARDVFPRPWGCKPFMTGVILHGLAMYDRIEPTPQVEDALVRGADYLWKNTYVKKDHGFIYAEAPAFMNRGGTWTLVLNGDGLARACAIAKSDEQKALLSDALRHNIYRSGISSFGKTFTQGICFMPYMLGELTGLGITRPEPVGSPAQPFVRTHAVRPPGGRLTMLPAVRHSGPDDLDCRVAFPWRARRLVSPRKASWDASPALQPGPRLVLTAPDAPGTMTMPFKVRWEKEELDLDFVLETVAPAKPGTNVGWITADSDHLANAARAVGAPVNALNDLSDAALATCRTVIVGDEAFEKDFDGCRRAAPALLRFAARGGILVVGQLNDGRWHPDFLPYDLVLSNDSTESGPIAEPAHPLFTTPNRIESLSGVISYDRVVAAAPEWRVLMTAADGSPSILEADIGAGIALVVMPSFDRAAAAGKPDATCRAFIQNLLAYAKGK